MQDGAKLFLFHTDIHVPNKMLCVLPYKALSISQVAFFGLLLSTLFLGSFKYVPVVSTATPAEPSELQARGISTYMSLRHQDFNTFLQTLLLPSLKHIWWYHFSSCPGQKEGNYL